MLKNILQVLLRLVNSYIGWLTKMVNYLNKAQTATINLMPVVKITVGEADRMLIFHIVNSELLSGKDMMESLFYTLQNNPYFTSFGSYRVMFPVAFMDESEYAYHRNVVITNETTFEDYWSRVKHYVNEVYISGEYGYSHSVVNHFEVLVWNMDSLLNKHITVHKECNTVVTNIVNKPSPSSNNNILNIKSFNPATRGFHTTIRGFHTTVRGFHTTSNRCEESVTLTELLKHKEELVKFKDRGKYIEALKKPTNKKFNPKKRFGCLNTFSSPRTYGYRNYGV